MAYSFNPFSGGLDDSGTPGISDVPSDNLVYGRKNGQWLTHTKTDLINAESGPLLTLIINPDNTVTGIEGSIGSYAYGGRSDLLGLQLGRSCANVDSGAFSYCTGFTGSLVIPDSVTTIDANAFYGCTGLNGSLTILNEVATLNSNAFRYCGFTGSLTIPGTTSIGYYAFGGCNFGGLNVTGTSVDSNAFRYCNYVSGPLSIANTITNIGSGAFAYGSGFTGNIIIPDSVTDIGFMAFSSSSFNGTLTIGNRVSSIRDGAFTNCLNLTGDLIIPDNVISLGLGQAFGYSGFNGTLTIGSGITEIPPYTFASCLLTGDLIIPDNITSIGESAFDSCGGFTAVFFGSGLSYVDPNAFIASYGPTTMYVNTSASVFSGSSSYPYSITQIYYHTDQAGWEGFSSSTGIPVAYWSSYPDPMP